MQEAFDPYSEWLGIPAGPRPPNHYALLGLAPGEADPAAITLAADAQRARIRRVRPGQYLADWSRLLDQIAAVKVCLLDPASKAAYDHSLMNPAPAAPFYGAAMPSSPGTMAMPPTMAAPPQFPGYPAPAGTDFGATQQPGSTYAQQGGYPAYPNTGATSPQQGGYPAYPNTGAAVPQQGGYPAPQQPTWGAMPTTPAPAASPYAPSTPAATAPTPAPYSAPATTPYNPAAPAPGQQPWGGLAPTMSPIPQAQAVTPGAATPGVWASAPTPIGVESLQSPPDEPTRHEPAGFAPAASPSTFSASPAGQARAAATKRFLIGVILVLLVVLVASLGVSLYLLIKQPPEPAAGGDAGGTKHASTTGKSAKTPEPRKSDKTPERLPAGEKTPPTDKTADPATGEKTQAADKTSDPAPSNETDPPEKPDPAPSKTTDPTEKPQPKPPEKPQPPNDARKRAAFNEAVAEARAAMYDRDLTGARQHVQAAQTNAQSPTDQELAARLDALLQNLEEFWTGVRGAIAKIEAPGELKVGSDSYVSVVDNTPERITLKVQGEVRRYQVDNLPNWLIATALGKTNLNTPAAKLVLGAYHAMDRSGDRARARQLWQEAARAGLKVDLLLPELDVPVAGGGKTPGERPVNKAAEDKVADLERRFGEAQTAANHKDVAVEALGLLEQAVAAKRLDYAARLAELAFAAARKSNSPVLMKQATAARQQIEALNKQN